ncbi:MAG: hypothetical protein AAF399_04655 [Bacteroidota bacterium]
MTKTLAGEEWQGGIIQELVFEVICIDKMGRKEQEFPAWEAASGR